MQLLIFAHRGEAQVFISEMNTVADESFPDLYKSDNCYILICGEGIQNASIRTAAVISRYHESIDSVLNFGIAGALDKSLKLKKIVQIRTVYAEQRSKKVEFKSFSSKSKTKLDCITSIDRIIDDEQAIYLSHFAQIVDRELWGIASACGLLNKPFYAYKLISDYAGTDTVCFDIKHQAAQFSQQLYAHYLAIHIFTKEIKTELIELPETFYATVSQQRHIQTLTERLALKLDCKQSEVINNKMLNQLTSLEISPKKRTTKLIDELSKLLNPFRQQFENELQIIFEPLRRNGIDVAIDESAELSEFKIQSTVMTKKKLEQIKNGLDQFDFQQFYNLLNGKTDV